MAASDSPRPRHNPDIPARLRERRDTLGLSRRAVAEATGLKESAIQRWELPPDDENSREMGADAYVKLDSFYSQKEEELMASVPRGTNSPWIVGERRIPRDLDAAVHKLQAEIIESGLPDPVTEALRYALRNDETSTMFAMGLDGRALSADEERRRLEMHIEKVKALLDLAKRDRAESKS